MKKKTLKIDQLQIRSFVTSYEKDTTNTLKAGFGFTDRLCFTKNYSCNPCGPTRNYCTHGINCAPETSPEVCPY